MVKHVTDRSPDMIRIVNNVGTMTMAGTLSLGMMSLARWDKRVDISLLLSFPP